MQATTQLPIVTLRVTVDESVDESVDDRRKILHRLELCRVKFLSEAVWTAALHFNAKCPTKH